MSDIVDELFLADFRAKQAGVDLRTLVVRSMPFGALIDDVSRKEYTPPILPSDLAYALCGAIKHAGAAAAEIARLRKERDAAILRESEARMKLGEAVEALSEALRIAERNEGGKSLDNARALLARIKEAKGDEG